MKWTEVQRDDMGIANPDPSTHACTVHSYAKWWAVHFETRKKTIEIYNLCKVCLTYSRQPVGIKPKQEITSMYDEIKAHLDTGFIETEKISRILSLAFQGEQNCILWGDAGHGKSLMVVEAIEGGLGIKREDYFVQSFGEGMSEDRLYGGMDFKKLNKEDFIRISSRKVFFELRKSRCLRKYLTRLPSFCLR